jgi:hypothetical protein
LDRHVPPVCAFDDDASLENVDLQRSGTRRVAEGNGDPLGILLLLRRLWLLRRCRHGQGCAESRGRNVSNDVSHA